MQTHKKTKDDIFPFSSRPEFTRHANVRLRTVLAILSIKEGDLPQYVFVNIFGDLVDNVVSLNLVLCLSHIELDYDKDINIDYRGGCIV